MSRPTLGTVALMQGSRSGFDYPQVAQVTPLIGDGVTPGGNAIIQGGALGFRQATIPFVLDDPDDVDTIRGYYEALSTQTYTDHDGVTTYSVVVLVFSAQERVGDIWDCQVTLVEVS